MEHSELLIMSVIAGVAALLLLLRSRRAAKIGNDAYLNRLEEIAQSSEHTKRTCFISLESMHRNLGELQARAESAERELSSFVDTPNPERKEQYEAAALLLAAGQSTARVAIMLNLPVKQVELVQEIRKLVAAERAAETDQAAAPEQEVARKKPAPRPARAKKRPILLTDIVALGANGAAA